MKLVIDCFKLVKGNGKSIGIYNLTKNLVQNLAKENSKNGKKDKIIVLGTRYNREDFDVPGVKFVKVKYDPLSKPVCILWELYLVTLALDRIGADRVLYPRGFAPLKKYFGETQQYVIIHDMIPFYYHEHYPGVLNRAENFYIMQRLKASAKNAAKVLTDSEASKKEILRITGINPWNVEVVYPGQNKIAFSRIRAAKKGLPGMGTDPVGGAVSGQMDAPEDKRPYISAIASGLPHKNADGVIRCYKEYCNRLCNKTGVTAVNDVEGKAADIRYDYSKAYDLVIIGIEDVEKYHLPKDMKEKITCYKYLEKDEDMHRVIRDSEFFLFLSKVEGFGFPPLEAMQLGVPVICSSASSIPEVTGDAAVLVDPDETVQVAQAMALMMEKPEQEKYRKKGYLNTGRFLWANRIGKYRDVLMK